MTDHPHTTEPNHTPSEGTKAVIKIHTTRPIYSVVRCGLTFSVHDDTGAEIAHFAGSRTRSIAAVLVTPEASGGYRVAAYKTLEDARRDADQSSAVVRVPTV